MLERRELLRPRAGLQLPVCSRQPSYSGVDDEFAARGSRNIGVWIPGRYRFGSVPGSWPGDTPYG
jgi:hypothetical protein